MEKWLCWERALPSELDFHNWNANWRRKREAKDGRPWKAILYVRFSFLRGLVRQF